MLGALKGGSSLKEIIDKCNTVVRTALASSSIREAKIALEIFSNGGKRLRPVLMLLSSTIANDEELGSMDPALVDLAGAIELIHLATLFHDDVIDDVHVRRGNPSAKSKYGNFASVLAGDFALSKALGLVQKSNLPGTMPEFIRTINVLVQGESRETKHKFDFEMTDAAYYEIISEKSASLFALSCKVAAVAKGSNLSDTLGHFGWNLGMAFQMIDDMDDMLDTPNNSEDCDLRNGYLALPIIRTLAYLRDGHRNELIRIIKSGEFTAKIERKVVSICHSAGTFHATHEEILQYLNNAQSVLDRFAGSESKNFLELILRDLKEYSNSQIDGFERFLESGN